MKTPMLLINFKTYKEASGKDALELVKICKEISKDIVCALSAVDINPCAKTKATIFAQHIDIEEAGGHTGKIHVKAIKENGAKGFLINHSEDRIPFIQIKKQIQIAKENNLISVVCSKTVPESKAIAQLNPDFIAIEPPELIGGDISVTTANPKIISDTVKIVKEQSSKVKVLCGAGIKNKKDVQIALKLGAEGILVASGVTKAKNKRKAVEDLYKGMC